MERWQNFVIAKGFLSAPAEGVFSLFIEVAMAPNEPVLDDRIAQA